jgi:hypothetical protein
MHVGARRLNALPAAEASKASKADDFCLETACEAAADAMDCLSTPSEDPGQFMASAAALHAVSRQETSALKALLASAAKGEVLSRLHDGEAEGKEGGFPFRQE